MNAEERLDELTRITAELANILAGHLSGSDTNEALFPLARDLLEKVRQLRDAEL